MRAPDLYRYFLGFKPGDILQGWIVATAKLLGCPLSVAEQARLHLTLCILVEQTMRDRFLALRVGAALADQQLAACRMTLGRWRGGQGGAALSASGRQDDIQTFYKTLSQCLIERGIPILRPKARLNPHITLAYPATAPFRHDDAVEWVPDDIVLIESHVGLSIHRELGRWNLAKLVQHELAFDRMQSGLSPALWRGIRV